jgi:LL-diaminopimelate aminotransferase
MLQESIANWFSNVYRLKINPLKEIYVGQGIHRILFDICLAYVEYGDVVLCPEPGMPFYRRLVIACGGVPVTYPVCNRTDNKPSLGRLDSNLGNTAKLLVFNNPNNPIGFMLNNTEIDELIHIASKKNIFVVNDAAYCSLTEEKFRPLRSIPGGSKVGLEVFSFPYTFGMNYIPLGFAIGPTDIIKTLKTIGSTVKTALPKKWITLCQNSIDKYPSNELKSSIKQIKQSRLEAERLAEKAGWEVVGGKSCPFLWVRIPQRKHSAAYAAALLRRFRILVLPGTAFGETGDGFLRLALTAPPESYVEAIERMTKKVKSSSKKNR